MRKPHLATVAEHDTVSHMEYIFIIFFLGGIALSVLFVPICFFAL